MSDGTFAFAGESFRVADKIGLMPLMRFAHLADEGLDSEDMSALAAMYDLLEQCVADDEWPRFQRVATRARADGDELMTVVKDAIQAISERPTGRPSDSSDGPTVTEPRSDSAPALSVVEHPSLRVIRELEAQGRPDKAEFVAMAMRAERSAS